MGFFNFFKKKFDDRDQQIKNFFDFFNGAFSAYVTPAEIENAITEYAKSQGLDGICLADVKIETIKNYRNLSDDFPKPDVYSLPQIIDGYKYLRVVLSCLAPKEDHLRYTYLKQKWNNLLAQLYGDMSEAVRTQTLYLLQEYAAYATFDVTDEQRKIDHAFHIYDISVNGNLSEIQDSRLNLFYKKAEILYFSDQAKYLKKKTKTTAIKYNGYCSSHTIFRGLCYKGGTIKYERITEDYWSTEASGRFFITNQRIGLVGEKAFSIPINNLLKLDILGTQLHVFKENRENPYIVELPAKSIEEAVATISYLLNNV